MSKTDADKSLGEALDYVPQLITFARGLGNRDDKTYKDLVIDRLENLETLLRTARRSVAEDDKYVYHVLQNCFPGIRWVRKAYDESVPVTEQVDGYAGHLGGCLESIELRVKQALQALGLPIHEQPPAS